MTRPRPASVEAFQRNAFFATVLVAMPELDSAEELDSRDALDSAEELDSRDALDSAEELDSRDALDSAEELDSRDALDSVVEALELDTIASAEDDAVSEPLSDSEFVVPAAITVPATMRLKILAFM